MDFVSDYVPFVACRGDPEKAQDKRGQRGREAEGVHSFLKAGQAQAKCPRGLQEEERQTESAQGLSSVGSTSAVTRHRRPPLHQLLWGLTWFQRCLCSQQRAGLAGGCVLCAGTLEPCPGAVGECCHTVSPRPRE